MDLGAVGKGQSGKNGKGAEGGGKRNKHSMHVREVETRSTRPQIVPTLIKNVPKMWKGRSFGKCVPISWTATTQAKGSRQAEQGWQRCEFSQNVLEL